MLHSLPRHLADRSRHTNEKSSMENEGPVVVWLKSSLRVHENPALDVGRIIASQYDRPLLVYQGVDERYPWASLRHHNMLRWSRRPSSRVRGPRAEVCASSRKERQSPVCHEFLRRDGWMHNHRPLSSPPWSGWVKGVAERPSAPLLR